MSRYSNSVPQIFKKGSDGKAEPIEGAPKYFFETGKSTPKTIYKDSALTIPQQNPVLSDADGRFPDIFLNGIYKEVQYDDSGNILWTRDPVGEIASGQFDAWDSAATYNIPDIVKGSDNEYYQSLTNNNSGNDPTTDAANWKKLTLLALENTTPIIPFNETDATTDNKKWDLRIVSEQMLLRAINDAEDTATNIMAIDRTGTAVDTVNFVNGALQNQGNQVLHLGNVTLIDYDITLSSYLNKKFSVSTQDTNPTDIEFSSDGLTMFMVGIINDTVYQYTLTTPWDISTASYASKSFSVATQDVEPRGISFKSDGLTMFMVGAISDTVYQYTLTTPWDISTASYASKSLLISGQDIDPRGIAFKPDGATMFMIGEANDTVYQYTLTTPWDISTASYASKSFSVATEETSPRDVLFSSDGLKMFVIGITNDSIYQYALGTAWDVSTAAYTLRSFSISAQETTPTGIAFSSDGLYIFTVGATNQTVDQYSSNYLIL